jgi:hypothetical protein
MGRSAETTAEHPTPADSAVAPSPTARFNRPELAGAVLLQAALAMLFLSPALFTGRYFSAADLLFTSLPWSNQAPAGWTRASNAVQFDSIYVFEPWFRYTADALHAGRLPLWNPDNYLGAPFIGNIQSAVFYPPNWLYYLWPSGDLYGVRAWLQLLLAALGMYLLARESLGTSRVAAHLAAVAFTYGAFLIIWLFWALTSVVIWLPWLWWATDRLMARPSGRWVAGLAGLVALTIFAGHPETTVHVALFASANALFRAWQAAPGEPGAIVRRLGLWAAGYTLGAGIAAIQLLPFVEYLAQSMVLIWRSNPARVHAWIPLSRVWTFISPDLFGNPAHHNEWDLSIVYIDADVYNGLLPLLLAPLAFLTRARGPRGTALLILSLALLVAGAVYRAPGIYDLVSALPGLELSANRRLIHFFPLALGLLAALGLDVLRQEGFSRRVALTSAVGLGAILILGLGLPWLGAQALFNVPTGQAEAAATWQAELRRAAGLLALTAGLVVLAGWMARRGHRVAGIIWLAFPVLLFADLWQARGDYNPTVAPADHFPATPATQFLQQQPPQTRFTASGSVLLPNTNLWYGLTDLRGYDTMEPKLYHEMVGQIDPATQRPAGGMLVVMNGVLSPVTNLLGVRYVLAGPDANIEYEVVTRQETPGLALGELLPGRQVGQTFVAPADRLAGVQLLTANYARPTHGHLRFHLKTDPAAPTDLATGEVDSADWPNNLFWPITFPAVEHSAGQRFYFGLEGVDTQPGSAPTLWVSPQDVYAGGTRWEQGQPVAGDFAFRLMIQPEPPGAWFTPVLDGGTTATSVYANRRAFPRAWLTHRVEVEADPAARPARLTAPTFDAHSTALLAAPLPPDQPLPSAPPPPAEDTVTITHYAGETVEIATRSPAAGVLILADQAFPGWTATVDGTTTPIYTADHALRGVYVPAGSHAVRFAYAPLSFWLGAVLTGLAVLLSGALLLPLRRTRQAAQSAGSSTAGAN